MRGTAGRLLVLGLGNEFAGDDAVGVLAVRALRPEFCAEWGGWYDFGFVVGMSIFFNATRGPQAYRGRSRRRREVGSG